MQNISFIYLIKCLSVRTVISLLRHGGDSQSGSEKNKQVRMDQGGNGGGRGCWYGVAQKSARKVMFSEELAVRRDSQHIAYYSSHPHLQLCMG